MMYKHLLNQTATLKVVNGTNEYSESNIVETKSIACRIEYKNRLITGPQGNQVSSSAKLFTEESVKAGDIINAYGIDYFVLQAGPLVDLDGNIQCYQVFF